MAAQRGGRGNAKDEIQALGPAEVEHFRRAVVAVCADQDLDPRPVAADLAHPSPQQGTGLAPIRAAGRAQHGSNGTALAIEHHDRLEAVVVVVGVEQPQLLRAVGGIEGVIHIEHDPPRHLAEAAAVELDHGPGHPQQGPRSRQVLQPRDGRLRAERRILGQVVERKLEDRIVPQRVGVVAVLVASGDHQHAKA